MVGYFELVSGRVELFQPKAMHAFRVVAKATRL
jgi:hypothetical protein